MVSAFFSIALFVVTLAILLAGFPVAFTLAGSALFFAFLGGVTGTFDLAFLQAMPERLFGVMQNETLISIPLFIFMGVVLEKSKISEDLLESMASVMSRLRGGLGVSVCLVGGLLAASTGIVGATVVTMGLISLPAMLNRNYPATLSSGIVCASGTLGQIIPPSIVLIILGDVISSANQQAQLALGNFAPTAISVGDLFVGALIPGLLLMFLYILYVAGYSAVFPKRVPAHDRAEEINLLQLARAVLPPILLIVGVLGSILAGIATPTEAASVGSVGALGLSYAKKSLSRESLKASLDSTAQITSMVFMILVGASVFSIVFRGFGGDDLVHEMLSSIHGGVAVTFLLVMLFIFVLGFFLDFFEITFVVVPLVGPTLIQLGLDPVWLGVMIALNLQTSFLTPPFGFSLFYLRGVAPKEVTTMHIYKGAIPFIVIQLLLIFALWFFPEIVTWLPSQVF